jgi:hypothetical protein
MTLFEYISVAISILLSLGMVHILSRAREVLEPGKRYWVHIVQVGLLLAVHPLYWWIFWGFRENVSWNLPLFLYFLVGPSLLCVAATSLVPRDPPSVAWRDYYYLVHRSYFVVLAMFTLHVAVQGWLLHGRSWLDPSRLFQGLVVAACLVGAFSRREQAHVAIAVAMLALISAATGTLLFRPLTALGSP